MGKKKPEVKVKKWKQEIRAQERILDREIRTIERDEAKTRQDIKKYAKQGEVKTAKLLAQQLVNARHTRQRLIQTKGEMQAISLNLTSQLATIKATGAMKKASISMKSMNKLMKIPSISKSMQKMSREMEKAGLIQEMVDDMDLLNEDDIEEEAQQEVDAIFDAITSGIKIEAPKVPTQAPGEGDVKLQDRLNQLNAM
eukprot:CAMPEP_0174251814 /NCGR_PEP_ID=MMETSP0439-20130205/1521_1 /TAXON_ID=0 /ORGANISM="Stereomyxa ramosa, Strain Chinc5" /LENGTH=197 /DNA_ID=CAMNT_0015332233 /DNA_START=6 /DNA_END=599 /DNA_ORIENTATION=+